MEIFAFHGILECFNHKDRWFTGVVLTDGADTASSQNTLDQLVSSIGQTSESGASIKVFTIAFGSDADKGVLQKLADPTGGKEYESSPENIQKIYDDIATFF